MNRRFAAATAVSSAIVLSLTGCLGEAKSSGGAGAPRAVGGGVQLTAAQVLQQASQKSGQTNSFAADISMQGTSDGEAMRMHGIMSYQASPLALRISFNSMKVGSMNIPGGMEMLVVDKAVYLKVPFLTQMTGGRPWIKLTQHDLKAGGSDFKELTQQGDQFDLKLLTKLLTTSKDVKKVGSENIGGVQTTHYAGTVGDQAGLAALTPAERKKVEGFLDSSDESVSFDVWVDGQQLPRKLAMKSLPGAKDAMSMTMVFHDYSKPVTITAPPADQVGKAPREFLGS